MRGKMRGRMEWFWRYTLGAFFVGVLALLLLFKVGYSLGYEKGCDAKETELINAWILYYDVESKGSYWDNREVDNERNGR